MASATNADGDDKVVQEFCEKHARLAASEFAHHCRVFSHDYPSIVKALGGANSEAKSAMPTQEILKKFSDLFLEHFEAEMQKSPASEVKSATSNGLSSQESTVSDGGSRARLRTGYMDSSQENLRGLGAAAANHEDYTYSDLSDPEAESPKTHHRPFFRRLSFKGLKKGKGLFHKQHSDEVELSHSHHHHHHDKRSKTEKQEKTKLTKIMVECIKEGIVNYLTGDNMDGKQKWEKCRLSLIKTTGGYMLEFFSPPKSVKPRSGVFCFLINEARETTALEMPDHENTFVLKAENYMEYVIEAHDTEDMKSWLSIIKYCMRHLGDTTEENLPRLPADPSESLPRLRDRQGTLNVVKRGEDGTLESSPDLPPDLPPRGLAIASGTGSIVPAGSTNGSSDPGTSPQDKPLDPGPDIYQRLKEYPWFHGMLSRSDAAQLVLREGPVGHGIFLVRQSETRKGEYVLTFNFQGRAKHLRMTINPEGQCRVQHLWFQTIFDMLEHFRVHPIPLESGGASDVTLTEFVVSVEGSHAGNSNHQTQASPAHFESPQSTPAPAAAGTSSPHGHPVPSIPEVREVVTYWGSVRIRSQSLENLQLHSRYQQHPHGRAIENTYSFV